MPNHISHWMQGPKSLLDSLRSEDREVDFNNIVPMPECLRDFSPCEGSKSRAAGALGLYREERNEEESAMDYRLRMMGRGGFITCEVERLATEREQSEIVQCIKNYLECGYMSWYEWSCKHWGTKWNAYNADRTSDDIIYFETAWNTPIDMWGALADKNPEADAYILFADEDVGGSNCGLVTISRGYASVQKFKGTERERIEFAAGICRWSVEDVEETLAELEENEDG